MLDEPIPDSTVGDEIAPLITTTHSRWTRLPKHPVGYFILHELPKAHVKTNEEKRPPLYTARGVLVKEGNNTRRTVDFMIPFVVEDAIRSHSDPDSLIGVPLIIWNGKIFKRNV